MDEITLTEEGWSLKNPILHFFGHFWQLKIHRIHKHSNTCTHTLNFHRKLISFLNARNNVLYQNQ